jgi:DNA-binding MarR family transcriptional regulator
MRGSAPERDDYADVPLSALLPKARSTYAHAVRRALRDAGCDDLPPAADALLGALHWSDASLEAVIRWMGVSKQAVGQLVDSLVERGYLERVRDPTDRRRVSLSLSPRGRNAGRATRRAIEEVDRQLRRAVGAERVTAARTTLVALLEIERKTRAPRARRPKGPPAEFPAGRVSSPTGRASS